MTASGRLSGSGQFSEYESSIATAVSASERDFLLKIQELKNNLKVANSDTSEMKAKLVMKTLKVSSLAKRVLDLERQVAELVELNLTGKK